MKRWTDDLMGLPEMRDEDMPPGWHAMHAAGELLGLDPGDRFNSQNMPDGGQAYWRRCRETGGTEAMALVFGPGEHPKDAVDALARLVRGSLAEVRVYLEAHGVDVAGDPMLRFVFKAPGEA